MEAGVGQVIAGRYRLERHIGSGGMASVFAAFDVRLERNVAVKIIHGHLLNWEEGKGRFLREARIAAQVQSPHVAAAYDIGAEGDEVYLVQELLSGPALDKILEREGPLDPPRGVSLAVQVCRALSVIHGAGFIHRDIKPSNLLLAESKSDNERVVLVDFGIAKILEAQAGDERTSPGTVIGTPSYMAPEQAQGIRELDARTDLYALGVTLFELLTGARPFAGNDMREILSQILLADRASLSFPIGRLSPELQAAIRCCLSVVPKDRYASAADLMAALLATPEGHEIETYKPLRNTLPLAAFTPLASSPSTREVPAERLPSAPSRAGSSPHDLLGRWPPEAAPSPSPKPSSELLQYLVQAGFALQNGYGALFPIARRPDCRLPPMRLWAILLEPENLPLTAPTMATVAFQNDARPLYGLEGTAESPHHVLALFRSPPSVGVYREWHELASRRHVYVLPVSPSALRAAVDANRAAVHLQELLRRGRRDPFELEGRIVTDLDFFGGREDLQAVLHRIDGASVGIGLFGLEKWGTTSLLYQARVGLGDRFSTWIDLAALPSLSLTSVLSALHEDLARRLLKQAPPPLPGLHGDVEAALLRIVAACHAVSGVRPVIFLDRVDELASRERCAPEALIELAHALYRLAFPSGGRVGAILVLGGREAHLLSSRTLGAQQNPLWGAIPVRYASFFSREEMGDFMQRLGALGGLVFDAAALDKAFELTFGHKYLSRLLGSVLCQREPLGAPGFLEVTPSGVSACAATLVAHHHPYFDAVLRRGPGGLRDILARLVEGPAALDELLASEAARAAGDPLAALQFAADYRLVVEEQGRYRLTMGLFEAWLRWTRDRA